MVIPGGPACANDGAADTAGRALVHDDVQWCPAWDAYLCAWCRHRRNEKELGATSNTSYWMEVG